MGFGHARGATLQPLNAIAHMFAGSRAFMTTGFQPAITGGALVLHFLSTIVWGVLLAYIAAPLTGWARAIAPVSVDSWRISSTVSSRPTGCVRVSSSSSRVEKRPSSTSFWPPRWRPDCGHRPA